jgi:hypothetical protein
MFNKNVTVKEYIRRKALGLLGLIDTNIDPRSKSDRLTFVNDISEVQKNKLKEYNVWYSGDSDELINFYTRASTIDYNTDPLYNRNKKSYFWAVSSTESDIKRTHSGQPRNIVDTLVNIVGKPHIGVGKPNDTVLGTVNDRLVEILDDNNFGKLLTQRARPLTFVEGWGAWKINWDSDFRDTPILLYYRADAVDFIYKSNQLVAIIYKDYYQGEKGKNYILFETRRIEKRQVGTSTSVSTMRVPCLIIEKELFEIQGNSEILKPVELKDLPQLKDVQKSLIIENFNHFLGYPCIFYEDNNEDCYGRSIFTGKIDMFDDLDQCMSQSANTVRRSTVHEYFNSQYLEKDEHTGMPIMPKDFDRKYVMFRGMKNAEGVAGAAGPVQVTQPSLNFSQYSMEEQNILLQIINGIMSPATLGIDIAKKDNAEAQREKEKVTIFTRNIVIEEEGHILKTIANDLLVADELMHKGKITCKRYDVFVKYDEFADASFEAKLETVLAGWQSGIMSDELAIEYLHKDSSKQLQERELKYVKDTKAQAEQGAMGAMPGEGGNDMMGAFGALGAENDFNTKHEHPQVSEQIGDELND